MSSYKHNILLFKSNLKTLKKDLIMEEQKVHAIFQMINDLNNMLLFVDKLNELDTSSVEPLIYMTDETNVLREDIMQQNISQKEALKNAPKKDSDYFKVPKMVNKK